MSYSAVLFDLDGTLVDSTPAWAEATRKGLADCSIHLTEQEHASLAFLLLSDFLKSKGHPQETIDFVCIERDRHLPALLRTTTSWLDGAKELLATLANFPTAIVTSSHHGAIDALQETLGIRDSVDIIVAWEDVYPRYKPHPYPLHLAAERLGLQPENCLYVGDLSVDIACANGAGAGSCLIRRPHTPPGAEQGALHVIERLEQVLGLMG